MNRENLEASLAKCALSSSIVPQQREQPNDFDYCLRESLESGRCREYMVLSLLF